MDSNKTNFKMKNPKWSIVIPALNEEKYLPRLLDSIGMQDFKDHEIIVADSDSDDNTVKIAKKYGCKVLKGRRGNPGINRNIGARKAKGESILFLDADALLPGGFLRENIKEFERKNLDVAGTTGWPTGGNPLDWTIRFCANMGVRALKKLKPSIEGYCIFAKKNVHDGTLFDEKVTFAEDSEYVERIVKNGGKFGILGKSLRVSMRRFRKRGKIRMSLFYLKVLYQRFFGEIRREIDYEFGKF